MRYAANGFKEGSQCGAAASFSCLHVSKHTSLSNMLDISADMGIRMFEVLHTRATLKGRAEAAEVTPFRAALSAPNREDMLALFRPWCALVFSGSADLPVSPHPPSNHPPARGLEPA